MSYRYLGNKTRLANWITNKIEEAVPKGSTIADPMCGTASVSIELARRGFSVEASDALAFPVIHAKARLLAKTEPRFEAFGSYNEVLRILNTLDPVEGYFFREFGDEGCPSNGRSARKYFTGRNAAKIDAMREFVRNARETGKLSGLEHAVLLQNLLLAVNDVANIAGTYGYFRAEISERAKGPIVLEPLNFVPTEGNHTVLQGDVIHIAEKLSARAVYLDPPYTKRQYAGNYHILETIAREDEPEAIGDGGLRPWKNDASPFCYRRTAGGYLRRVVSQLNASDIFVSYTDDGQISPSEIVDILSSFGNLSVHKHSYNRYRSNSKAKDGLIYEKLYHLHVR